jgi:hypothetical protein
MLGYQTVLDKSMNGIKTISDGEAIISDGNLTATNIYATNITGTITTSNQPNITNIGTLTNLDVSGTSNLKAVNTDSIVQSVNSTLTQSGLGRIVQSGVTAGNLNIMAGLSLNQNADIYMNGSGKISQSGSESNVMKTINMTSNSNVSQSGTGIVNQSGSNTNIFKASNFTGRVQLTGDMVQISGANTLFDTNITNITQPVGSVIIQSTGQGVSVNAFNKTTITDLIVTNSLTIPSNVTMPNTTYNGDLNFINTAKIVQSGSSGINDFNGSTFNGDVVISGNLNMIGGSSSSNI